MNKFKMRNTLVKLLSFFSLMFTQAQWTDNGNNMTTMDRIGIGTTNPSMLLHLKSTYPYMRFEMDSNSYSMIEWHELSTRFAGISWSGHKNPKRLDFFTYDGSSFAERMSITSIGNVGIGTNEPTEKLDVDGNLKILSAHDRGIIFQRYSDKLPSSIKGWPGEFSTRQGLSFNTSSVDNAMNILWNGNVGIGTTNPDVYKLAVNGKIRAKEIKVETGWADYVFKEDYDLPTLEEVEKHIQEKGHLINIPSAEEVEENGIQLGEMNKLLLEKIEELTLYTVQQQKQINDYQNQLNTISKKLERLEKQINNPKP